MAGAWMVTVDMRYHNPCSSFASYCTAPRLCGLRIHRLFARWTPQGSDAQSGDFIVPSTRASA